MFCSVCREVDERETTTNTLVKGTLKLKLENVNDHENQNFTR